MLVNKWKQNVRWLVDKNNLTVSSANAFDSITMFDVVRRESAENFSRIVFSSP